MRSAFPTRSPASNGPSSGIPRLARLAIPVLLALLAAGSAGAQVAVDQIEVFLTPRDPDRVSAMLNVSNEFDRRMQAILYISDWDRDSTGQNRFFPTGTLPRSCHGLVQVSPAQLSMEPRSQQAVRINLVGADTVSQACWSIVFVELQDPIRLQQGGGRSVQAILRVGTKVFVEPRNVTRSGDIVDMRIAPHALTPDEIQNPPADTARNDVVLKFQNTGGTQVRVGGRIEIRRPDNTVAATLKLDEFPVLPGAVRRIAVPISTLASGKYIAIALLDFGGADIAGGQVEFEMP
jgi:P pilus assembly chaperone PapD